MFEIKKKNTERKKQRQSNSSQHTCHACRMINIYFISIAQNDKFSSTLKERREKNIINMHMNVKIFKYL